MKHNKKILFGRVVDVYKNRNNEFYTNGSFSMDVWNRYLVHTDNFSVLSIVHDSSISEENLVNIIDTNKVHLKNITHKKSKNIVDYFSYKKRKALKKQIEAAVMECDVLIVRMPSSSSNIAFDYGMKYNKTIIIEVVGSAFHSLWYHSFAGKVLAIKSHYSMKKRVKKSKNVIYVTERYLQHLYPTLGNQIACSNVNLKKSNIIKREVDVLHSKQIRIGTIGKIDLKYKGHRTVIDALSYLKKNMQFDFKYELVGSGNPNPLSDYGSKKNIKENLSFLSTMAHEEIFKWLSSIDIYIQPSFTEGLPRSVIEAMASGCIVIGSNVGGIPELLDKEFIFNKGNYKQLALILEKIINKKIDVENSIVKNRVRIKEFLQENLEDKRFKFFDEVINNTK